MNRLVYSNIAIEALNSAKMHKNQLLSLDRDLSSIQTDILILQVKGVDSSVIMFKQNEKQHIQNRRTNMIYNIANEVNTAIINATNALKISVQQGNSTMVILDDYMLQNIANFINEYYKSDEIKSAIKKIVNTTIVKYNIERLLLKHPQMGLISLNHALMY